MLDLDLIIGAGPGGVKCLLIYESCGIRCFNI